MKISYKEYTRLGGLRNSDLYRKQVKGRWYYYSGAVYQ